MSKKNWFGLEPHTTDDWIWEDNHNPREVSEKLKKYYDILVSNPEQEEALHRIMFIASQKGWYDKVEDYERRMRDEEEGIFE